MAARVPRRDDGALSDDADGVALSVVIDAGRDARAHPRHRRPLPRRSQGAPGPTGESDRRNVSEFVRTHEYRYVYDRLWHGDATEASVSCEVRSVERVGDGYRAVVGCSGYSNTRGTPGPNATGTDTAVHADYFTRYYARLVDDDSLVHRQTTAAERPASDGSDTSDAPTPRPADASDGRCPEPTYPTSAESASV